MGTESIRTQLKCCQWTRFEHCRSYFKVKSSLVQIVRDDDSISSISVSTVNFPKKQKKTDKSIFK